MSRSGQGDVVVNVHVHAPVGRDMLAADLAVTIEILVIANVKVLSMAAMIVIHGNHM